MLSTGGGHQPQARVATVAPGGLWDIPDPLPRQFLSPPTGPSGTMWGWVIWGEDTALAEESKMRRGTWHRSEAIWNAESLQGVGADFPNNFFFSREYQSCNFHRDQEMTHMCIVVTSTRSGEAAFGHGPAAVNTHFWEEHYLTAERPLAERSNLLFSF